jgi:hypothetical protein
MKNKEADAIKNDARDERKQRITPKKERKIIDNKIEKKLTSVRINENCIRKNVKYSGEIKETEKKNRTKINIEGNEQN